MIAKIMLFTNQTCPHCNNAREVLKKLDRDDFKVREISTSSPDGSKIAQQYGIMSVPTVFVKGPEHPEIIGLKGVPSEKELNKSIDVCLGKDKFKQDKKGFFRKLFKKE